MEIRPAAAEDLAALLRIERQSFVDPWEPQALEHDLQRRPQARVEVLVVPGDGVVGFIDYWIVLDELEIHDIAVAVEHRGRGYGRALLEHALGAARREGVRRALLDVRQSNAPALCLYRSLDFAVVGRRRGYYRPDGEDALTMALELDADPGAAAGSPGDK